MLPPGGAVNKGAADVCLVSKLNIMYISALPTFTYVLVHASGEQKGLLYLLELELQMLVSCHLTKSGPNH